VVKLQARARTGASLSAEAGAQLSPRLTQRDVYAVPAPDLQAMARGELGPMDAVVRMFAPVRSELVAELSGVISATTFRAERTFPRGKLLATLPEIFDPSATWRWSAADGSRQRWELDAGVAEAGLSFSTERPLRAGDGQTLSEAADVLRQATLEQAREQACRAAQRAFER
jgi:hypothetical protein